VNFTTGANHSAAQLGNLTDSDCATCHGPNATASIAVGNTQVSIQVASAHANLVEYNKVLQYSKQFAYSIQSASLTGAAPTVTFSVTDPTTPGHLWNILTDAPFIGANCPTASIGINLGWSSTDYTNTGSSVASEAQPYRTVVTCNPAVTPVQNADGSFTVTLPAAASVPGGLLTAGVQGSAGILIDGFPAHDFNDGQGPQELAVTSLVGFGAITDPAPVARRNIVDVAKCDSCHNVLNAHGNHRVDSVQACAVCHNPNATDIAARLAVTPTPVTAANAPDGMTEQPIDLKYMIHALHDGNVRATAGAPYVVYHRGSFDDFRVITPFPGALNNCLGCHLAGTFYPQDPATWTALATTTNSNGNSVSPAAQVAMTPATSACSSCHVTVLDREHMVQNGGSFTAVKLANSQLATGNGETCALCHGAGAIADVAVVHNLALYQ
jgi:OmcA/MtrC family decaheme c-type cytochrome